MPAVVDLAPVSSLLRLVGTLTVPVALLLGTIARRAPSFAALMLGIGLLLLFAAFPRAREHVTAVVAGALTSDVALTVAAYVLRRHPLAPERGRWGLIANVSLVVGLVLGWVAFAFWGLALTVVAAALGAELGKRGREAAPLDVGVGS